MSQYDFGTIDTAATDGVELATLLENHRDAVNSSHSGVSRPSYAQNGTPWISTARENYWDFYICKSSGDILIGTYDIVNSKYVPANAALAGNNTNITKLSGCGPETGSISIGVNSLQSRSTGTDNTAVGAYSLLNMTTGVNNVAIGGNTLRTATTSSNNTSIGQGCLYSMSGGEGNVGIGAAALLNVSSATESTSIGCQSGWGSTSVYRDTFVGACAGKNSSGANANTYIGYNAGSSALASTVNTFVGANAGSSLSGIINSSILGANATVTGSNQVQLGNSSTTTYVYGTVQNRSDERDKSDIRPTVLGLSFINSLTPVDYKWDLREDYKVEGQHINDVLKDGSKKRNRYHHGFIAQEVKVLADSIGEDFGGYQDHKENGGQDVLSLGYDEFIAPIVKAIQELSKKIEKIEEEIKELKGNK